MIPNQAPSILTLRGQLIRFEGNPFETNDALVYERDGLIHAVNGKIVHVGDATTLLQAHPELQPRPWRAALRLAQPLYLPR